MLGAKDQTSAARPLTAGLHPRRRTVGAASTGLNYLGAAWFLMIVVFAAGLPASTDLSVEEMKSRLSSASIGDKPHLCVQIAERQLVAADRQYSADDIEHAQASMTDVVTFSELARDYAIQSHKYQKQTEIAVRTMARKLGDIKHLVSHDDQAPIQAAINRLQRVRDDLLMAMFPKGRK